MRTCSFTEPFSVPWCSWAIHIWNFFEPVAPGVQAAEHRFPRGLLPDVEEHRHERDGRDVALVSQGLGTWRASTAADMVTRTCLDDDMVSDQYIVRDLNLFWYFAPICEVQLADGGVWEVLLVAGR